MITAEEALTAIDPSLPDDQREESALRLIASSAALDAYLDSRPQLEQIIARANGAGKVSTFAELNPEKGAPVDSGKTTAIESTAVDEAEVVETDVDKEIKALEERVSALRAGKGA